MTRYFLRPSGGSDSNDGLSYAAAFATYGKFETVCAAGDELRVAPGRYRATWTITVSGTAGNHISVIGDEDGKLTDGVGGPIYVTGSDNDQTSARTVCIACNAFNYRRFKGIHMDSASATLLTLSTGSSDIIIEECFFDCQAAGLSGGGASTNWTIRRCIFVGGTGICLSVGPAVAIDNVGHVFENNLFVGGLGTAQLVMGRCGDAIVRYNTFISGNVGFRNTASPNSGHPVIFTHNIVARCGTGVQSGSTADVSPDWNNIYACTTPRNTVNTGTNDTSYPVLMDAPLLSLGAHLPVYMMLSQYSQLITRGASSIPSEDLYSESRPNPTSIGAVHYAAGKRPRNAGRNYGGI